MDLGVGLQPTAARVLAGGGGAVARAGPGL